VLIVSSFYWPEVTATGPYVTGMAEHLAAHGHSVDVATTFAHYPEWRATSGWRLAKRERIAGVTVRRRALYVPRRQSVSERALYEASMFAGGLTAILPRRPPDAVVGFMPNLSAGALTAVAARAARAPYGLVVHDLMGPGAEQSGVPGGGTVARAVRALEGRLAAGAAGVAIIAESFRDYFTEHGVPPERLRRVRTWTRRSAPDRTREEMRAELGWREGEYVCVHAGNMGQKQGLDNLLDAARLLEPGIVVGFVGDGNDGERLKARAAALGLTNVRFVPTLQPGRYEAALAAADALLVNQRASVVDMSLPSKLTSYFAAGRPVVAAVSPRSETAREIAGAGGGVVVPAEAPEALAAALSALRADPAAADRYAAAGRRYADAELRADRILDDYERFAEDLVSSRRPATPA
jgi:glycosyltransferase involved in cell wall biosynthesis